MSLEVEVDFSKALYKRPSIVFAYGYVNGPTVYFYDDRTLSVSLGGEILTASMFHDLPEGDWSLVQQPAFEVIGHLGLSPDHLDLLLIDTSTGQLYAVSAAYTHLTDAARKFVRRHRHTTRLIQAR